MNESEATSGLLIAPLGHKVLYAGWPENGYRAFQIVDPVAVDIDERTLSAEYLAALISEVHGSTDLRIVATGNAAHLAMHLLARTGSGACALISPPLGPYMTREVLEPAFAQVSRDLDEHPEIAAAMERTATQTEAPTGTLENDEAWLAFMEEVLVPAQPGPVQDESRARLQSYREILERKAAGVRAAEIPPWWDTVDSLTPQHKVEAFSCDAQPVPNLPIVCNRTDWPGGWWRTDATERVAQAMTEFFQV